MGRRNWIVLGMLSGMALFIVASNEPRSSFASQHQGLTEQQLEALKQTTNATIQQISQALTHTLFAWSGLDRSDRESGELNAHRVLNILEGPQGPHYDPSYGRPEDGIGDGVGGLIHSGRLIELLKQVPQGSHYQVAAENVRIFLEAATTHVLRALELLTQNEAEAAQQLRQAQGLLMGARGSREEKNRPTEGGARTILAWLEDL